jgi:hypothetical protein
LSMSSVDERAESLRWRRGEPPGLDPPTPLRPDEVVCRSCHLVVRRRDPLDVPLLICDDCRYD